MHFEYVSLLERKWEQNSQSDIAICFDTIEVVWVLVNVRHMYYILHLEYKS